MSEKSASRRARGPFVKGFSKNSDFDFELRLVLGSAAFGASDPGEALSTVATVGEKDHDAWFAAWSALGDRTRAVADAAADAQHPVSAAAAYLRAATYYGVAVNAAASLADSDELLSTFRKHRSAWDRFIDTTDVHIERVEIPYERRTLPGYFFSATEGDGAGGPRRTLLMINGSDGPISSLWPSGGAGALARGYNVLMFDGPGQQSMLFEENIPFRPDWEAVATPVVDFLLTRADVDNDRIAAYAISQGGYWLPRALAFEHRIAAAIADPGVVDVSASWTAHLPGNMKKLLDEGQTAKFDRDMATGMKFSHELSRTWNFRARPYGKDGYAATLQAVRGYTITPELAAQITTPLLITSPEDEQFWPGQSEKLAELAPSVSTVVDFTAAEGANFHCQPLARALTDQRMFDWLDEHLA